MKIGSIEWEIRLNCEVFRHSWIEGVVTVRNSKNVHLLKC